MKKLNVNFYLKGDKMKNGENAIYLKIKVGNTSTTMASGLYISKDRWKMTNMLMSAKKIDKEVSHKNYIQGIQREIERIYLTLLKENSADEVTATNLKNAYLGKSDSQTITFKDVCNFHIRHFKKRVEKGEVQDSTMNKYKRVARIFEAFLLKKYKKTSIEITRIDDNVVFAFDDYLRYERDNSGEKGVCNNTAVKYLRNLKTIFNFAAKRKFIAENPFNIYEEKLEEVETTFLDPKEFEKLKEVKLPTDKLNTVRDIFLFSCYTSYAPVDAMNLTVDNIDLDIDGDKWIRTKRQKTQVTSDIIILPPVQEIIDKYKNDPRCTNKGKLLPRYSNQKINEYLKDIAKLAGIEKNLTWYVSRHTFATTVCLSNDIRLEYVSKMMGHKKITQTQHYAKLLDDTLKSGTEKLKEIYA